MKPKLKTCHFNRSAKSLFAGLFAVAAMALLPFSSQAQVLLSSGLSGTNAANARKGVTWTMGTTSYDLVDVQIRLRTIAALPDMANVSFTLHSNALDGSNNRIGSTLLTFTDPTLTASTTATYTLTSTTPFTLQANTKYWFVAYNADTQDANLQWMHSGAGNSVTANLGSVVPATGTNPNPRGIFTAVGNTLDDPTTWTGTSSVYNDIVINVIPEPSSMALLGLAGLGLLGFRRNRSRGGKQS